MLITKGSKGLQGYFDTGACQPEGLTGIYNEAYALGNSMRNGESFRTPEAIVSVAHTDSLDIFTERLTRAALEGFAKAPESEQELPVLFNEYCTTWGSPSHENIEKILRCIKGKGFRYFVIDCGWYKESGVPWDVSMGDYEVSKELFPEGLDKTTQAIRDAGMVPGIWFEIETTGRAARAYQMEERLLHKDGAVLTSYFRRFWDMRDPWGQEYLSDKVIGTLKKYGFGYMKIDYNETIGMGCDGAESLGEGLRQNMEAAAEFIEKVKREVPGIVLENCSSGGHRLEPGLMSRMSMASFSDALLHTFEGEWPEVIEIPLPERCPESVTEVYAAGETDLIIEDRVLRYRPREDWEAVAVFLSAL